MGVISPVRRVDSEGVHLNLLWQAVTLMTILTKKIPSTFYLVIFIFNVMSVPLLTNLATKLSVINFATKLKRRDY